VRNRKLSGRNVVVDYIESTVATFLFVLTHDNVLLYVFSFLGQAKEKKKKRNIVTVSLHITYIQEVERRKSQNEIHKKDYDDD
jgi:hypothetical protein